jgi:type II secretory ATPase GspE/PulE/Tfp pilus assembly ATPase PilB-like protein
MSGEATTPAQDQRLQSDQLMLELGLRLVESGRLSRTQIEELSARRALTGGQIDRIIIREGLATETEVLQHLSDLSHIPFHHLADFEIKTDAVQKMQARVALRYRTMPLELANGILKLAVSELPSLATADSLRMLVNSGIEWVLSPEAEISQSIKYFYGLGAEALDTLIEATAGAEIDFKGTDVATAEDSADAGVIKFVNQIISEAIRRNATDIHIEPFQDQLRLRYRIDGMLQQIPVPKGVEHLRRAVVSCIKIMADCNISERRKPHDGRIKVRFGQDEFDLRVSILPTVHGETIDLRILNRKSMFIDLEHLGLMEAQMPPVKFLSALPHGVVLITGPTGSGKTTTLYALLSRINRTEVKIITVEDPIEYQIHGINQIQVHPQIDVTFATVLRSILRHNPDIILIGEIRDSETADIAVRASLTGHLVFSTLHTNDAPSAVTRLADMGVEPYLISSCLEGAIAQRLVRRICSSCKTPVKPDDTIVEEISAYYPDKVRTATFYRGHGCPDCDFTGYRGRQAIFEIMVLNDKLRNMIVHQRPSNELCQQAIRDGLITLRQDGWARALAGVTTIEEVVRVARKIEATGGAFA